MAWRHFMLMILALLLLAENAQAETRSQLLSLSLVLPLNGECRAHPATDHHSRSSLRRSKIGLRSKWVLHACFTAVKVSGIQTSYSKSLLPFRAKLSSWLVSVRNGRSRTEALRPAPSSLSTSCFGLQQTGNSAGFWNRLTAIPLVADTSNRSVQPWDCLFLFSNCGNADELGFEAAPPRHPNTSHHTHRLRSGLGTVLDIF